MATEGSFIHPMDQFVVKPLLSDAAEVGLFTFTNATLWMLISVAAMSALLILGTSSRALVPSRTQSAAELLYGFVRNMVEDVAGKGSMTYFPYIFTAFAFILGCNMLGMIPGSFTPTSHFAVTVTLAVVVFVSVTIIGFVKHGAHFLELFWPMQAPAPLRPVLCVIEVISYFVRPVSHSIRLGANMMAGHAVLKVFAGLFAMVLAGGLGPLGILPLGMMVGMTALEFLVAFVQAYVFTILTCVYLHDALHMH